MPITNGIYTALTFNDALASVMAAAPSSIKFSPGNPPELVLANMFAQADVLLDQNNGQLLASMMSPAGAMIDLLNPNNPRRAAVAASGYVLVSNSSGTAVSIAPNTILTAASGQTYSVGVSSFIVPSHGSAEVFITCTETGLGGNIPAGIAFTVAGQSSLSGTNTLPILNGSAAESDAIYWNRIVSEKSEYGAQNGSVAVENALKEYYADARLFVNNTISALSTPVPVPGNGYNCIVLAPFGILSSASDVAPIWKILANRLEFINAQNVGDARHVVMSGTEYTSSIPQTYFATIAQPISPTFAAVINIRASSLADTSELIAQANSFADYFIERLFQMFPGAGGSYNVTYKDGVHSDVVTAMTTAGSDSLSKAIAPAFGIQAINALVCDMSTITLTPQILYDSTVSMSMVLKPGVSGESSKTLAIGGARTFIDFVNDDLFTDHTSWYDRYVYLDPTKISVTIQVSEWF